MKLGAKEQQSDGTFEYPAFAWPGGYPIIYFTADSAILCPDCANGKNGSEASADNEDKQWRLVACDVHWEDPPESCEHCNAQIESAYGEPDSETD